LGEFAFFTFRVAATEADHRSRFLRYAASVLEAPLLRRSASGFAVASKRYADMQVLFMDCVMQRAKSASIADQVEALFVKAYHAERDPYLNLGRLELMGGSKAGAERPARSGRGISR